MQNSTLTSGPFRKLSRDGRIEDLKKGPVVPYPRNHTGPNDYVNMTRKSRMNMEMNGVHWKKMKRSKTHGACKDILYWNDANATKTGGE